MGGRPLPVGLQTFAAPLPPADRRDALHHPPIQASRRRRHPCRRPRAAAGIVFSSAILRKRPTIASQLSGPQSLGLAFAFGIPNW